MIKVALIEDDPQMCEVLSDYLSKFSMETVAFTSPSKALQHIQNGAFDIIILDLTLPEMDGLEVCKILIAQHINTPIIISSARNSVMDKVLGLELGADDYLPKPFDPRELVARIHAAVRKKKQTLPQDEKLFEVDESRMNISKNGEALQLTFAEYEVLKLLIQSNGGVLTRDQIVDSVTSMKWESTAKSVDVIIGRIRQKIGDSSKTPLYILAVKGVGYKFIG